MEDTRNDQVNRPKPADLIPAGRNSTTATESMVALPKLLLASSSPRRSEILRMIGWPFELGAVEVDESLRSDESPHTYVQRVAAAKAVAAAEVHAHRPVVAADTTVVIEEHVLAKPTDVEDAKRMLRMLQGRWHQVLTGLALVFDSGGAIEDIVAAEVPAFHNSGVGKAAGDGQ